MANSSVYFPPEVVEQLDKVALRVGKSRNRVIVKACERYLQELEAEFGWPGDFFAPLPNHELQELNAAHQEMAQAIEKVRSDRQVPGF